MSSLAKINANRRNAQHSTGPKTPEGKAASARNATSHGLSTAQLTVLPTENQSDLDALASAITGEFKPQSDSEQFFVSQMIHARWRLARIQRLEAEAFDRMLENYPKRSVDRSILATLERPHNVLDQFERYRASAERTYSKALRELTQLRANREKTEMQNKAKDAELRFALKLEEIRKRPTSMYDWDPPFAPRPNEPVLATAPDDTAPLL